MQQLRSDNSNTDAEHNSSNTTSHEGMDVRSAEHSKVESTESDFHDDLPIEHPEQDLFGYGPFADAIAKCILGIEKPNGGVIAIHGPWGSGKSSLVNLVCHKINNQKFKKSDEKPIIIPFNSWSYRTEDGVVFGFFKEFHSRLVDWKKKERNVDVNIDPNLVIDLGVSMYGAYAIGNGYDIELLNKIKGFVPKLPKLSLWKRKSKKKIDIKRIEDLQSEIGEKLRKSGARVLIVIDDIDRLSQEEAKAIFRLIKSVGRIKNVMYLLAYDREVTEKMIKEAYHSEGNQYLDKVVQASFDLPEPMQSKIIDVLNSRFFDIFGSDMLFTKRKTFDVVHEVVVPEIRNLRSVHKLSNMLFVTYQSVKWDVNLPDFIALETFRLFRPNVYQEIRCRKNELTRSVAYHPAAGHELNENKIEDIYLAKEPKEDHQRLKKSLVKIFPSIDSNYGGPTSDVLKCWKNEKRARSVIHFDTYFRFSISNEIISNEEFQEFVENASNQNYIKSHLLDLEKEDVDVGRTRASFMLDKISLNVESIDRDNVEPFLNAIYSISGELTKSKKWILEFGHFVTNIERIKRLTENLLENRFNFSRISEVVSSAVMEAPLNVRLNICRISHNYHLNRNDAEPHNMWSFICRDVSIFLTEHALHDVRVSASNGTIFEYDDILNILENWQSISNDKEEVKNTFNGNFEYSDRLVRCAYEFGRVIPSISHDDFHTRASLRRLGKYIDLEHFERRLNEYIQQENLDERNINIINRLLDILKLREKGGQKS